MSIWSRLILVLFLLTTSAHAQNHDVRTAPFTALRWSGETPEVRLGNEWYGWTAIDAVAVDDIVAFCKKQWPTKWRKRVGEDLVEALHLMGEGAGAEVGLELTDLGTGEALRRKRVAMTEANRRAVLSYNRRTGRDRPVGGAGAAVERVKREHRKMPAPVFAFLAKAPAWDGWTKTLPRAAAERDLDQLEWLVQHTFSYRDLRGVDVEDAFDAVRLSLADDTPRGAFAVQVARLLSRFGDGHARVGGLQDLQPRGYLPFLVADAAGGVVAFKPDRSGFVDEDFPFLVELDGRGIDEWLAASTETLAQGSPQFVRFHGLRNIRLLDAGRLFMGLPLDAEVDVVLADAKGRTRELQLPVARRKPTYGPWPRAEGHRVIEGNIGYLRLPSMDDDQRFVDGLVRAMDGFRKTRGLIIDVRGNGGGTRDALRALLPYFLDPEGGPQVVNVAAFRLRPGDERGRADGYLSNRFMFPAASARWSEAERLAIERTARSFRPDWTPNPGEFSTWHYLALSPGGTYHYSRPVIVLTDSGCFSATDIFVGAFADLPQVTLMGAPTGGGSGRSRKATLAESGLGLRLSTMASFRSNGQRYDGKGIEVDVTIPCAPEDHLRRGRDTVLRAAIERLR